MVIYTNRYTNINDNISKEYKYMDNIYFRDIINFNIYVVNNFQIKILLLMIILLITHVNDILITIILFIY